MARGADLVVGALERAGVRHLFSLPANQILSVYDATVGRDIRIIHTRHEAAAVHMADAWGRLSEEPGVALVTAGPGHMNALSALYGALMAESPVVLLSGHAPAGQGGRGHQGIVGRQGRGETRRGHHARALSGDERPARPRAREPARRSARDECRRWRHAFHRQAVRLDVGRG